MAIKENPANDQYNKIIRKYNGSVIEINSKFYQYTVPGKSK